MANCCETFLGWTGRRLARPVTCQALEKWAAVCVVRPRVRWRKKPFLSIFQDIHALGAFLNLESGNCGQCILHADASCHMEMWTVTWFCIWPVKMAVIHICAHMHWKEHIPQSYETTSCAVSPAIVNHRTDFAPGFLDLALSLSLSILPFLCFTSVYSSMSFSTCICVSLPFYLSVCLSTFLSVCLPFFLSVCRSIFHCVCLFLSFYLSMSLLIYLSVRLSIYLSGRLYLSFCVSTCILLYSRPTWSSSKRSADFLVGPFHVMLFV